MCLTISHQANVVFAIHTISVAVACGKRATTHRLIVSGSHQKKLSTRQYVGLYHLESFYFQLFYGFIVLLRKRFGDNDARVRVYVCGCAWTEFVFSEMPRHNSTLTWILSGFIRCAFGRTHTCGPFEKTARPIRRSYSQAKILLYFYDENVIK